MKQEYKIFDISLREVIFIGTLQECKKYKQDHYNPYLSLRRVTATATVKGDIITLKDGSQCKVIAITFDKLIRVVRIDRIGHDPFLITKKDIKR